jgi:hypothetical protein
VSDSESTVDRPDLLWQLIRRFCLISPPARIAIAAGKVLSGLVLAFALLGSADSAEAAPDPRSLIVQRADMGTGWVTVDDGPSDPNASSRFVLFARVLPDGTQREVSFAVSVSQDTGGSDFYIAQVQDAFYAKGIKMSDVPGLGDGPAYGSVEAIAQGGVRAAYVFRVKQFAALVQAIGPAGARTDIQSLAMENARRQEARFVGALNASPSSAATSTPIPIPSPTATPVAKPLDARALALPLGVSGSGWATLDQHATQDSVEATYFNDVLDQTGYRLMTLTVRPMLDELAAEVQVEHMRASLEDSNYVMAPWQELGDGRAYRGTLVTPQGLSVVAYVFRVGPVAVIVDQAGLRGHQAETSIDTDVLQVAHSQLDRIRAVLRDGGTTPAPEYTPPPVGDPSGSVLPLEQSGDQWALDKVDDRGTAEQRARTHSVSYRSLTQSEPPLAARLGLTFTRNQPSARMVLGVFRADLEAQGYTFESAAPLGDDGAFAGRRTGDDGVAEAGVLYRVGAAVVQVFISLQDGAPDDLAPLAWELGVAQHRYLADADIHP